MISRHRKAIGWSIADLKGINPLVYSHRINLEEDAKPVRQIERRVNPLMKDVVKSEVVTPGISNTNPRAPRVVPARNSSISIHIYTKAGSKDKIKKKVRVY